MNAISVGYKGRSHMKVGRYAWVRAPGGCIKKRKESNNQGETEKWRIAAWTDQTFG